MPYGIPFVERPANNNKIISRPVKHRPTTWLGDSVGSSLLSDNTGSASRTLMDDSSPNPFHAPPTSFRSPHSSLKGKHKLSPSPSPRNGDYDFVISSPRPALMSLSPNPVLESSSSPVADSPTPAFGVASATAKLRLADDDSPIRHVPGHSRSLAAARVESREDLFSPRADDSPYRKQRITAEEDGSDEPYSSPTQRRSRSYTMPAPPLFASLRASQSQDGGSGSLKATRSRVPRLSVSHPIRPRAGSNSLSQKKTVSLGEIQPDKVDETFGSAFVHARKARASLGPSVAGFSARPHRRPALGNNEQSISRSMGLKSGLSLSLSSGISPMPDFSTSNSSLSSSASTISTTPPASAESLFENVKPNQEVFEAAASGIKQKFKARDSAGSLNLTGADEDRVKMPPPSVLRLANYPPRSESSVKRARSLGNAVSTPIDPPADLASKFDFVCQGVSSFAFPPEDKPTMPNTPVKRQAFGHRDRTGRIQLSASHPVLGSNATASYADGLYDRGAITSMSPAESNHRPPTSSDLPQLTVTSTSSPDSAMDTDEQSPTVRLGSLKKSETARLGLLRRISGGLSSPDCCEEESTPTKGGRDRSLLTSSVVSSLASPSPSPMTSLVDLGVVNDPTDQPKDAIVPRLSLPAFGATKQSRRLHHRQSHPMAPPILPDEKDLFDSRFVVMHPLGKGAFSTVLQVRERDGNGVFAVKKTRGVFDGVMGRLRYLEEVDILRHLSKEPNLHVVKFVDAWEQNRQLYIQTEAAVGSLAAFLAVFGHEHERLDEARIWKMVRDLSDGLRHIHSHGVIHFDIKPDNILVSADKSLKIADFGLATRWPRLSPGEVLAGSGLGGSIGSGRRQEKLEREGDRIYMPPEMLRGVFVMAADIFSFGLVVLESAMNIYLPDGGPSWQALRENNFSFIDLSPLSGTLADLIIKCLQAEHQQRPSVIDIDEHPVVQRARRGGPALAPEDPLWLAEILSGGFTEPSHASSPMCNEASDHLAGTLSLDGEGDVVMTE